MSDKRTMPCPACREAGSDKSGDHLTIYPSGKFSCAVHPGEKAHNRRIIELMPELGSGERQSMRNGHAPSTLAGKKRRKLGSVVATYPYHDQTGKLLFEIRRHEPKDFLPYLPGAQCPGIRNVTRVPYRLPDVIKAKTVWIVEGEKDADRLAALGIVATCNPFGAGKWDASWSHYFAGKDIVICGDNDDRGRKHVEQVEAALTPVATFIRRAKVPGPHKDISDALEGQSDGEAQSLIQRMLAAAGEQGDDHERDIYRFDEDNPPPPSLPVYTLDGAQIATRGNLVGIYSRPKCGKTAARGAMLSAVMGKAGDSLGFESSNPEGFAVLDVDTEQSQEAFFQVVATAMRRAGIDRKPAWLWSTSLLTKDKKLRLDWLENEMRRAAEAHGGIHSVLLDGGGDFVFNPNDLEESCAAVMRLHQLAVTFNTVIVVVLHFNPNPDMNKARGHLGSELERKAETNLTLEKDDKNVTTVYTTTARHASIPKAKGHRFTWSDEARMHITCEAVADKKAKAVSKYDVQALLKVGEKIPKTALISKANSPSGLKIGMNKAKGFISELVADGSFKVVEVPRSKTNPEIHLERVA